MLISDLMRQEGIVANLHATSKKQVLQQAARQAALVTGLDERRIFDTLMQREKLGTTGIGHGVAIPHGKLPELNRMHGFFIRLQKPVDFQSVDDQPVDLVFLLLAPEEANSPHLQALASVSHFLRDEATCEKLRQTDHKDALYALICGLNEQVA